MYVCMYTCVCIHIYIYIYIYVYTYVCVYMYMYVYTYTYVYTHIPIHLYIYIYIYIHMHTCVIVCLTISYHVIRHCMMTHSLRHIRYVAGRLQSVTRKRRTPCPLYTQTKNINTMLIHTYTYTYTIHILYHVHYTYTYIINVMGGHANPTRGETADADACRPHFFSSSKRSGTRRDPATDIINNSQKGLAQPYS